MRNQQHEREKEQSDHALMLQELQKLLNAERKAKETLEIQLDDKHNAPEVSYSMQSAKPRKH